MKVQTRLSAALAFMMATGLACLAEDQNTEAKAEAKSQTVQIQAGNIEYDAETKAITATGNVVITSPSDRHGPTEVVLTAAGDVVITKKDGSTVKGKKVIIKTDESAVAVSGGVKVDAKAEKKSDK